MKRHRSRAEGVLPGKAGEPDSSVYGVRAASLPSASAARASGLTGVFSVNAS